MDYRIMIHLSGGIKEALKKQLFTIAAQVYGKHTEDVIFRIRTTKEYENRRKLFIPGDGKVVELQIYPHITLSQKIEINEDDEVSLLEILSKIVMMTKPFSFISSYIGDYGENFTIFLAFKQNESADELKAAISSEFKEFFPKEKEKRDILHTTLMYDDADEENFKKAWELIDKEELVNKKLQVSSVWLWNGWKPYKEFKLKG